MLGFSVYVETSVWSFAFAMDLPDSRAHTLVFFDRCRQGLIRPYVSSIVLEEISRADEETRDRLAALIRDVGPTVLDVTDEAEHLAEAFVQSRVVPRGKPEDARHVALAFVEELDILVS